MSNPLDVTLRELNECGCDAGHELQTPAATENRPGLPAVAYRVGVHSQFMATLMTSLSSQRMPMLRQLRTRDANDFSIALLDAFACMADVLTFYDERIANEAFLRTAIERRSVSHLAQMIGYELAPGVAAKVNLAFQVEGARGATGTAQIPPGTRVQSIPGPGEQAQTFETESPFIGRAQWNDMRVRMSRPQNLSSASSYLFLVGTSTNLKVGDVLVLAAQDGTTAKRIKLIQLDLERQITRIDFAETPAAVPAYQPPPRLPRDRFQIGPAQSVIWHDLFGLQTSVSNSISQLAIQLGNWTIADIQLHFANVPSVPLPPLIGVFAQRTRLGFFGHNAPRQETLPKAENNRSSEGAGDGESTINADPYKESWDGGNARNIHENSQGKPYTAADAYLERVVPGVTEQSFIVLDSPQSPLQPFRVAGVHEESLADYGISNKCTAVQLATPDTEVEWDKFKTRSTSAYVDCQRLDLADTPIDDPLVAGETELPLSGLDLHLQTGQAIAVSGTWLDPSGVRGSEIVEVAELRHGDGVTTLTLRQGLQHGYVRSTVSLNANVVSATHGESVREVLGSGDASRVFQSFTLKQKPLTFTFPADSANLQSSLQMWVDDIRWREVPFFYGCGPRDRVYIVRRDADERVVVQFGDGERGARLPSGNENVRAVYRQGIGKSGIVSAAQIQLLMNQPLGVKSVTNPLPSQGAADPQALDRVRVQAPRSTLTLDRIVSLQDYADTARDFPGIAKAHAVWTWIGPVRGILLTVLGPDGVLIAPDGQPAEPLRTLFAQHGLPHVPVRIVSKSPSLFSIAGKVIIDSDALISRVESAVRDSLRQAFSFSSREFGQGVSLSEVIAVIQAVKGVESVDIKSLNKCAVTSSGDAEILAPVNGYLSARLPTAGGDATALQPAELLLIDELSLLQLEVSDI